MSPPRGIRDSRTWYADADPLGQVDGALVDWVAGTAGPRVLDLGCGLGGYARALAERGFDCRGLDVSEEYVAAARALGVDADVYDGVRIPLDDGAVDTVILLEVIEHLPDPVSVLREARRVALRDVLVSTPNCTQDFGIVPVEFSHMLDLDHRRCYTARSLAAELEGVFGSVTVEQTAPLDLMLAGLVVPPFLKPLLRGLDRAKLLRPRYWSRLLARGAA